MKTMKMIDDQLMKSYKVQTGLIWIMGDLLNPFMIMYVHVEKSSALMTLLSMITAQPFTFTSQF